MKINGTSPGSHNHGEEGEEFAASEASAAQRARKAGWDWPKLVLASVVRGASAEATREGLKFVMDLMTSGGDDQGE